MDQFFEAILSLSSGMEVAIHYDGTVIDQGTVIDIDSSRQRITVRSVSEDKELTFGFTVSETGAFESGWRHLVPDPMTDRPSFGQRTGIYDFQPLEHEVYIP